jgi:HAD superfamily hydrolase (TIGR01549 family)
MEENERGAAATLQSDESAASFNLWSRLHPLLKDARAVLFDAGGTLTHPDWERLALLAKQETGRAFETIEMRRTLYLSLRELDGRLSEEKVRNVHTRRQAWVFHDLFLALGIDEERCERLRLQIIAAHNEKHIWCGLDPEVPLVVNKLKRAGLLVGVISNTEDGRLKELLELVEIAAHFDLLVDSYVVGLRKPDAVIFQQTLEQLALKPHEAVYIGDSYGHDVLGARSAGLRAILLDPLDLYRDGDCPRIHSLGELIGHDSLASEA